MKILIGLDESPCSNAALEYVRNMTWPAGTRVLVASAVRPPVAAYSEVYVPPATEHGGFMEDLVRSHQEMVSRGEARLQSAGMRTEARVLHGDPRETLVQTAIEERVDLIVVGSHGRTGLAKLLMGSVAAHVVAHAPCSVLVVKLAA